MDIGNEADRLRQSQFAFGDARPTRERPQQLSLPRPFDRCNSENLSGVNREIQITNSDATAVIQHVYASGKHDNGSGRTIDRCARLR